MHEYVYYKLGIVWGGMILLRGLDTDRWMRRGSGVSNGAMVMNGGSLCSAMGRRRDIVTTVVARRMNIRRIPLSRCGDRRRGRRVVLVVPPVEADLVQPRHALLREVTRHRAATDAPSSHRFGDVRFVLLSLLRDPVGEGLVLGPVVGNVAVTMPIHHCAKSFKKDNGYAMHAIQWD